MYLNTDEQTIGDLGIFGRANSRGIYDAYNNTHTRGGETLLAEMFRSPLSDREAINRRSSIIEDLAGLSLPFPFNASLFDTVEKYLTNAGEAEKTGTSQATPGEKEIRQGVRAVIELIGSTRAFTERKEIAQITQYAADRQAIMELLSDPVFDPVHKEQPEGKRSFAAVTAYDGLFRIRERRKLEKLLGYIYYLDVYMSVAKTAREKRFIFPRAQEREICSLRLEGVYHPSLEAPVGNDISMNSSRNVIFLTGANMAGKSTFLRSVSTALYLAHMGFPVAARAMEFSVLDGMYTTINLPDNLGIGASHFYAEVLRVKKVATELHTGKSLFILFDELFRGTNVKDAHEATVAVTNGFAGKRNSLFIISSHIVEAGEALRKKENIDFLYLPTRMNGHVPEYTYRLEKGITDDRHGMIIIRNEGILEKLKNGRKPDAGQNTSTQKTYEL